MVSFLLKIVGLFNEKIKLGVNGRAETFEKLKTHIKEDDNTFWFHCASLGEYEQGVPVFEKLKESYLDYKIVISFFSPSGYEIKKNTPLADVAIYLPMDTKTNAKRFLDVINPKLIIFVKYDFWPNYLYEIKKRHLNAVLISALFRDDQSFFKTYGSFMRKALFAFQHVFTQDEYSKKLLEHINYKSTTVAGDTRFDRVYSQLSMDNKIDFIETFIGDKKCVVFGSTWPEDDKLYIDFINNNTDDNLKFIIAPHNVKASYVKSLESQLNVPFICFSNLKQNELQDASVFVLDTIGYLSRVYSYADIAYVGGGAGNTGLHNVLEPAVFGIPIIIGKNFENFPEAKALIKLKGVISVTNKKEMGLNIQEIISSRDLLKEKGNINLQFINKQIGATNKITTYIYNLKLNTNY